MWQTKYTSAVPINLGVGVNFWLCSESYFLSGRPYSVSLFMLGCRRPLFSTIIWSTTNLKTGKRISQANAAFYSVLDKLK